MRFLIYLPAVLLLSIAGWCAPNASAKSAVPKLPPYVMGVAGKLPGEARINRKDEAVMVWVPAGKFLMGTSSKEFERLCKEVAAGTEFWQAETPQHLVELGGYWIYKYEVTVAQYRKFCTATKHAMPIKPTWGWQDDYPIVNVSWEDAAAYAKWAGVQLPTEAQWEKAARGDDGRIYTWGSIWDGSKCNNVEGGPGQVMAVGSFTTGASPYGAEDMCGNVWEWCSDWFDKTYYHSTPAHEPAGPKTGTIHSLRGGAWTSTSYGARIASRVGFDPELDYLNYGFRCAVVPVKQYQRVPR